MITVQDEILSLKRQLEAQAIGLQNVYNEFEKYKLSDINEKIDRLLLKIDVYEKSKNVEQVDVEIKSYPMDIKVNMRVETNFGDAVCSFNYPPLLEYELHKQINGTYVRMLNGLYEEHEKRGGKFMGDEGCAHWMKENGETHLDFNK